MNEILPYNEDGGNISISEVLTSPIEWKYLTIFVVLFSFPLGGACNAPDANEEKNQTHRYFS